MSEMREWWANVYVDEGETIMGEGTITLDHCVSLRNTNLSAFRIYVRLKPDGAPKRYRDGYERWIWENGIGAGSTAPKIA